MSPMRNTRTFWLALAGLIASLGISASEITSLEIIPPTGPFNVGVSKHAINFTNPNDPFAPGNVTTQYLATVYYPTLESPPCSPSPYLHPKAAEIFEDYWGFVRGNFSNLTSSFLHWGAAPASSDALNHSTLIFGPGGLGPSVEFNTMLLSDLASKGYAVVGIDHLYEQPFAWFPNPDAPGGGGPTNPGKDVLGTDPHLDGIADQAYLDLHAAREREMLHVVEHGWPALVAAQGWPFATASLGLLGHSFGGSVSLSVAAQTSRELVAAAINMDGSIFGGVRDATKPALLLSSSFHIGGPDGDPSFDEFAERQTGWWRWLHFETFGHLSFADMAFFNEVGPNAISDFSKGTVEGARAVEITRVVVAAFFDRWVRGVGEDGGLFDRPEGVYEEVSLVSGGNGSLSL
ncbi:hypothetical protein MCOR25_001535 [Pyricularia grisea]|nr:hypothetical protein MCOR25_001535 [Pyricularia grisea]